jgi:hypothetical protein
MRSLAHAVCENAMAIAMKEAVLFLMAVHREMPRFEMDALKKEIQHGCERALAGNKQPERPRCYAYNILLINTL